MTRGGWAGAFLGLSLLAGVVHADNGAEGLRNAKTLFFDRKYAEARDAWLTIQASGGAEAEAARYWIARCSESLGEGERALREYGEYLERRPKDATLAEEARTSQVGLAARLYKAGGKRHLAVLQRALTDPSRTVRYFAALQLSGLGCEVGQEAFPVLRRIVAEEKDPDLVERAKLAFLRCDPKALRGLEGTARASSTGREVRWIKVRVFKKGRSSPEVAVNLPVALAELVFKSLPDEARRELGRQGYDADNFWARMKRLGPTQILEIDDGEDGRVQIWTE